MSVDVDTLEKQFIDLVGEFQLLYISESRLKEAVRTEATRAEAAEAARDDAVKTAEDHRAATAGATAGAKEAARALSDVQNDLTNTKIQLDLAERQRSLFEEKCSELSEHIAVLEKEVQEFKHLKTMYTELQKQFIELQERVQSATDSARSEATRLENELRHVEKCASAGTELRERARLAAAAHARERRLAADELLDTTRELQSAKGEVTRLKLLVTDLESKVQDLQEKSTKTLEFSDQDILLETKAALEAERNTTTRLEKALATATADNAVLAAEVHRQDNIGVSPKIIEETEKTSTNICPIDSFLAD
ncbi:citron Rho-interacting kinase-like [Pieris napi]|uniref:citron Rho-interacting kinase-like n=1 Tax=Pieris napi TaxID=78633 RepID=UPI001FB8FD06|nr:citron Rho-interacting kinase-like [Pieris napi]